MNTEQNSAAKEKDERLRRILLITSIVVLAASVGGMVYCGLVLNNTGLAFRSCIVVGLAAFWLINDVISPIVTHQMDGMTQQQRTGLILSAVCDLVGYAGLAFFFFADDRNVGIYGVLAYGGAAIVRRRLTDTDGQKENAETEEEAAEPELSETVEERAAFGTATDRIQRQERASQRSIRDMAQMNTAEISGEGPEEEEQE